MGRRIASAAVSVVLLGTVWLAPVGALAPSPVDPRLVGSWEAQIQNAQGTWTLIFTANANGSYRTLYLGPGSVPDETGTLKAQDGRWSIRKANGQTDRGTYTFSSSDTVTFQGQGPAVMWRRVSATLATSQATPPRPAEAPFVIKAEPVDPAAEQYWITGLQAYEAKNYRGALPALLEAAKRGYSRAQALLGIMYEEGRPGVAVDLKQAVYWFERAAHQGHRAAQFGLGVMYEEGQGVAVNAPKAAQLYELSARQGFPQAQFALGLSYEFGEGVPRNRKTAISWLDQAAAQGDGRAGWISDWLRRPDTPNFQTELQLAYYISAMVGRWMATSEKVAASVDSTYGQMSPLAGVVRAETIKRLESNGNHAQAERCRLDRSVCP
jgi:hypothetical protein